MRRKARVRKKVLGTDARPRVCVFRSNKHIYAQVISDDRGMTLAAVSTLSGGLGEQKNKGRGIETAKKVGLALAKICQEKNITSVVFDRNGFLFHGKIKALADGAREGGLEF
jgi:large subunit ribosomal protein L18